MHISPVWVPGYNLTHGMTYIDLSCFRIAVRRAVYSFQFRAEETQVLLCLTDSPFKLEEKLALR